ncbi:uncharacterized protein SPAPADRAFT_64220 [Spathaspora passalidarum NRRL Y-27907]|uniref:Uncharacterized protein n=1 Tax=Spathaspora passalidarum (strain NRRL Y-27907 / 11-Y1) TaxID=619300 RepID=G3AFN9_SPAPN|nr:uncharacterized protein SPAPADRAFT_64220 [Spathaspora passalidarum NRRL Y-27907]EGW35028.1 hypothetical protein SPAPADRAFT_64220 [Spathaspora passalidarum NRRL Y-27907]
MGFINPGKSLKKRKLRQSTSITTSASTSEVEYRHKSITNHLTFVDLPNCIIRRIFIEAGPGNNIPLMNKSLRRMLKFDKEYVSEGYWDNLSLVLDMVRKFYAFNLNERLDFDVITKKMEYYTRVISYYKTRCPQNINYKRLVRNHDILRRICLEYTKNAWVLLDKVLSNNFISNRLLDFFTSKYLVGASEESVCKFMTRAEVLFMQKLRLRVVRFKFAEMAMDSAQLANDADSTTIDYNASMEEIVKLVDEWNVNNRSEENIDNPRLSYYDDEKLPVKEIPYQFSFIFDDGFLVAPVDPPSMFRIPATILGNGINSIQKFQLVQRLLLLHPDSLGPVDVILSKTFRHLQPDHIHNFPYRELPVGSIIPQLLSHTQTTGPCFGDVIIDMFRLFDSYTKIDYSIYGDNVDGDTIVQDLSKGCFLLLAFYFTRHTNVDSRPFWTEAIKLRNIQLTQVLSTFEPNPEYDILHNFHRT